MATTWMKALHKLNGRSISAALDKSADYTLNPDKTENGELVDSYECSHHTAQAEFLLSKRLYEQKTGRDQGRHDVIAYHIRMSFKPGEVTAEKALELGRELALRWTRGKHQFIVAAHTNTNNPHVHIIYNSVTLDHDRKFQDFKRSAIALRRVSDQLCLEHGLSIIENPGLSKGYNRAEHLGESKAPTVRDQLRDLMDSALSACTDYNSFLRFLQEAGIEIKQGKQLSFKIPGGKRFVRQDTLGDDYSPEAILERISGKRVVALREKTSVPQPTSATPSEAFLPSQSIEKLTPSQPIEKPNMLIDIQAKLQQGYGTGFEHWAGLRNLKDMAKTLLLLQEWGLDSYDALSEKADAVTKSYNRQADRIKEIEARQKEISELQRNIGTYSKTKDILAEYNRLKSIKPSALAKFTNAQTPAEKFYAENESSIILCNSAKKYFDAQGYSRDKPLPAIKNLQTEYAKLEAEKKKIYSGYKSNREEMIALKTAKHNVDMFLGAPQQKQATKSYERDAL